MEGTIKVGDEVDQAFDEGQRWLTMKNHTGTHVLNFALNSVLGSVDQKGSLVAPDRMRFDFTSNQALNVEQVKAVEEIAQKLIDTQNPVYAKECKTEEAKKVNGLRAVFGEVSQMFGIIFYNSFPILDLSKSCSCCQCWCAG
jgi:alanyl-tRNA synthetase